LLEFGSVVTFFGLVATAMKGFYDRFVTDDVSLGIVCGVGTALILGMAAADLASGIIHWACDNWGSGSWPAVGPALRQFRHHHIDASAITRRSFQEVNGNTLIISLPLIWAARSTITSCENTSNWALASFLLSFGLCGGLTNQFHCWAHMEKPPRLVRYMQHSGLILSRQHHHWHHIRPNDRNYCVTNGWMNHLLITLGFFEAAEWLVTAVTGAVPLHARIGKY
jgi:hypothetical protein